MRRNLLASTLAAAALAAALAPSSLQAQGAAPATSPYAAPPAARTTTTTSTTTTRVTGTATTSPAKSAAKVIYDAQIALNKKGFAAGTPDGQMGPATRKAIQSFQYSQGMPSTGQLTDEVLDKLGVDHAGVQLGAAAAPAAARTRAAPRRAVQCADFLHQDRPGGSDYHGPPVRGCN
jgi:peptidoglycan hydrolase-like protein with peptidoglycan-binding domain